jgi:hypothetical protein
MEGPMNAMRAHYLARASAARVVADPIIVTPMDVIAYRKMWDPFVLGLVKVLKQCGDLWQKHDPSVNTAQFAIPPDDKTFQLWGQIENQNGDGLLGEWNKYAGLSSAQIVFRAREILESFQATVLKAGGFYAQLLRRDCPKVALPDVPSTDLQAQVIGRIEGLKILAEGVLQILAIGISGALEAVGSAAQYVGSATKKVVDTVTSPLPWVAIGLVALVFLVSRH